MTSALQGSVGYRITERCGDEVSWIWGGERRAAERRRNAPRRLRECLPDVEMESVDLTEFGDSGLVTFCST